MGDEMGIICLILLDNLYGYYGCLVLLLVVLFVYLLIMIWFVFDILYNKFWNVNFGFIFVEVCDDVGWWKGWWRELFMFEFFKFNMDIVDVFMYFCWGGNW